MEQRPLCGLYAPFGQVSETQSLVNSPCVVERDRQTMGACPSHNPRTFMPMLVTLGLISIPVLLIAFSAASPYWVAAKIKAAIEDEDLDVLSRHLDYARIRTSLKAQLHGQLRADPGNIEGLATEPDTLGISLAGTLIDSFVDVYVTPEGLSQLAAQPKPHPAELRSPTRRPSIGGAKLAYRTFNSFTMTVAGETHGDDLVFLLRRRGMTWTLEDVQLPTLYDTPIMAYRKSQRSFMTAGPLASTTSSVTTLDLDPSSKLPSREHCET